jgi:hypothetical protein
VDLDGKVAFGRLELHFEKVLHWASCRRLSVGGRLPRWFLGTTTNQKQS